jgi:hypothetical protein
MFATPCMQAQNLPFQSGEELYYNIRYKYGVVVMKGGTAQYGLDTTTFNHKQVLKSALTFKTNSFFDKIFMIRDTLNSYANFPDLKPLYHNRSVNEGGYHFTEEMLVLKHGSSSTEVNVKRMRKEIIRIDTIINSDLPGYDLLNIFLFVRNMDYSQFNQEQACTVATFLGEKKVNIIIKYHGQAILQKNDTKYKTLKLTVDVVNEVFTESKNAIEVWISNDENHVPLKIKAKLRIGAAEAELSSYKNLKYPFTAAITLTSRK